MWITSFQSDVGEATGWRTCSLFATTAIAVRRHLNDMDHGDMETFVCRNCGKEFKPKKRKHSKYCSRGCSFAWRQVHGFPERRKSPKALPSCEVCGNSCSRQGKRWCSKECSMRAARDSSREYSMRKKEVLPKVCKECGAAFIAEYGDKRRSFCSSRCARLCGRRIARFTRSARERGNGGEKVDPVEICQRDKWTCYLCGKATPRNRRGTTELDAPEVDHVVPLAKGGAHAKHNLRCCCRACNLAKGDTVLQDGANV